MTPTIHHIVNGQVACGRIGAGYADHSKVLAAPNGCPDCISKMKIVDSIVLLQDRCNEIRSIADKMRGPITRKRIKNEVEKMELILNKFVK